MILNKTAVKYPQNVKTKETLFYYTLIKSQRFLKTVLTALLIYCIGSCEITTAGEATL
jgi:hypothetical protein